MYTYTDSQTTLLNIALHWAIPFYTCTPPMGDKISQSGFVQGTNKTFVRGVLFEYWDVSMGQNRHVQGVL